VWAALMHVCCNNLDLGEDAIRVGHLLAGIPDWYPHIQKELCSWITIYFGGKHNWDQDLVQKYNFVLATVWRTDPGDYQFSNASQRALGLTFLALKTLLKERFNFAPLSTLLKDHFNFDLFKTILRDQFNCVTILHCINLVVLRGGYRTKTEQAVISSPFITAFSQPLHDTLVHMSTDFKLHALTVQDTSGDGEYMSTAKRAKQALELIAKILEDTAREMPYLLKDLDQPEQNGKYWQNLRNQHGEEIKKLEQLLQ
jgi:hypothetical protein